MSEEPILFKIYKELGEMRSDIKHIKKDVTSLKKSRWKWFISGIGATIGVFATYIGNKFT